MATYKVDELDKLVEDVLDKVSSEAKTFMSSYINRTADNPTGRLADSIYNERRGKNLRAVGSRLPYAKYVDQGRGPVSVKNKKSLHWVYPRPGGVDFFAKQVGPADPIGGEGFLEATKKHIDSMRITI